MSGDLLLGVPYNLTSYSILVALIAHIMGLRPGKVMWNCANLHLYANHIDQAKYQLEQTGTGCKPSLDLPATQHIHGFTRDNVYLNNYYGGPKIRGEVAV